MWCVALFFEPPESIPCHSSCALLALSPCSEFYTPRAHPFSLSTVLFTDPPLFSTPHCLGKHKSRKDKAARLASVLEGREGREKFGARSALKKKKTAGLSEREKQRRKAMPMAARVALFRRRNAAGRGRGRGKNFKGHVRG